MTPQGNVAKWGGAKLPGSSVSLEVGGTTGEGWRPTASPLTLLLGDPAHAQQPQAPQEGSAPACTGWGGKGAAWGPQSLGDPGSASRWLVTSASASPGLSFSLRKLGAIIWLAQAL